MRRRTRLVALVILGVVLMLLALGALPTYIKSGKPYHMTATPVEQQPAVNVTDLDERRYPYITAALASVSDGEPGHSRPYWKGYVGFKEVFTHSPFDEVSALQQRSMAASDGDLVTVMHEARYYRLTVKQR